MSGKEKMRAMWMAGDFGKIAEYTARYAEKFVEILDIKPGMQVLDVACGTGNLAIPAARKGARVTGVDIASNLLEQARARAETEGLKIALEEGDAEHLHFPDEHFDLVMSMFGAMFAPDPDRVASELAESAGMAERSPWPTGRRRVLQERCFGSLAGTCRLRLNFLRPRYGEMKPSLDCG